MNVISIFDVKDIFLDIISRAEELKGGAEPKKLSNKTLGLLFEKASTRTRVSFEVAMTHLGGHSIYLNPQDTQLGRGESVADTAKTLSRYLDAAAIRTFNHSHLEDFSQNTTIPVINALSDMEHPCQALADMLTIKEKKGGFDVKMAYIGDGNNVCNSLIGAAAIVGLELQVATPNGYEPDSAIVEMAKKVSGSKITLSNNPSDVAVDAEIIYTDVWVSMGQESSETQKLKDFKGFQVNDKLLNMSNDALVMHCLPAHRGVEITDKVLNSRNSIVFDQAENRLHVQKALLENVMK